MLGCHDNRDLFQPRILLPGICKAVSKIPCPVLVPFLLKCKGNANTLISERHLGVIVLPPSFEDFQD